MYIQKAKVILKGKNERDIIKIVADLLSRVDLLENAVAKKQDFSLNVWDIEDE